MMNKSLEALPTHSAYTPLHTVDEVVAAHRARQNPTSINYRGRTYTIFPDVFSPFIAPSGHLSLALAGLPIFQNKRILDVGSGCGIFACLLKEAGAETILGLDINPSAIANAQLNVRSQQMSGIEIRESNLFEALGAQESFDIVFADLPFTRGDVCDNLDAAFFDPDLRTIRQFLIGFASLPQFRNAEAFLCLSNLDGLDVPETAQELGLDMHPFLTVDLLWIKLMIYCVRRQEALTASFLK